MRRLIPSILRAGTRRAPLISAILLAASCGDGHEVTAPIAIPVNPTVAGRLLTSAGDPVAGAEVSIGDVTATVTVLPVSGSG